MNEHEVRNLVTLKDLLEMYPSFKESWIRRLIFLNKIPYFKIEGSIRFDLNEVEKWIEEKKITQETEL